MSEPLLKLEDFVLKFRTDSGIHPAVEGISMHINPGEMCALIGESGCGKSVTALSIIGLEDDAAELSGTIAFEGDNLLDNSEKEWEKIRGNRISMIFQEPMTALNPLQKTGKQIEENLLLHQKMSKEEARAKVLDMMRQAGLPEVEQVYDSYPHQLSGGQRQRIMIAMAFINEPKLLIADEPTTALDVTIQAQILELMKKLNQEKETAVLFISHDLRVIQKMCTRAYIMYAGRIVEEGSVEKIMANPLHPYTRGLLRAIPSASMRGKRLVSIPGTVPSLEERKHNCCPFAGRCPFANKRCQSEIPQFHTEDERNVLCFYHRSEIEKMEVEKHV